VPGREVRFRFPAYARDLQPPDGWLDRSRVGPAQFTLDSRWVASIVSDIRHPPDQEHTMSEQKPIRLELTEEQKAQVKAATGKDARALELNVEELEQRIAPTKVWQGK
jgi:hypothetical protein